MLWQRLCRPVAQLRTKAHTHDNSPQTRRRGHVCFLRTYLVQFPHCAQRFDLVRAVFSLLQALVTHRRLTLDTVHAQILQFVLRACGDFAGGRAAADATLRRRHQAMFGEGPAGRMAAQAARVAVEHVALLAHHGGLLRTLLAQLALEGGRFALLVSVHDPLQHPVLGESAETPVVQDEAAVTLGACDAGITRDGGQRAGVR